MSIESINQESEEESEVLVPSLNLIVNVGDDSLPIILILFQEDAVKSEKRVFHTEPVQYSTKRSSESMVPVFIHKS